MAEPVVFALVLLVLLQTKHLFADFYLQNAWMLKDRGVYLNLGRLTHAAIHAVGSVPALLVVGVPLGVTLAMVAVEWVAHFHIDWGKGVWTDLKGHGPADASYWRAFGADQALHQWTYIAMVWYLVA